MRLTLCDTRNLAVALIQPANDKFYNWTSGQWEAGPLNPANHIRAFTPMEASPSVMSTAITVDIGGELLSRPDADAAVFAVSGSGATASYTLVDIWTLPLAPYHTAGGFSRL